MRLSRTLSAAEHDMTAWADLTTALQPVTNIPPECPLHNVISAAGGIQMTVCLVIIAIVLAQAGVGQEGHVSEPWVAWFVLVFVCIYIAAYAWSCKLCSLPSLLFCIGGHKGLLHLAAASLGFIKVEPAFMRMCCMGIGAGLAHCNIGKRQQQ